MGMQMRAVMTACLTGLTLQACSGCGVVKTTSKIGWEAAKLGTKTAWYTGKYAGKAAIATTKLTANTTRTMVYIARGKTIVPLSKEGNSLFAEAVINRKAQGKFLVDTGASKTLISRSMARQLNLPLHNGEPVQVSTANGQIISGREIELREVRIGRARITHVQAIVLDEEHIGIHEGLLGMSFLNHFVFQIDAQKPELILQQRVVDS